MDFKEALEYMWKNPGKEVKGSDNARYKVDNREGLMACIANGWRIYVPDNFNGIGLFGSTFEKYKDHLALPDEINEAIADFCQDRDKIIKLVRAILNAAEAE